MISPEKIIVALDESDPVILTQLIKALYGTKVWIKIGMEAYFAHGPKLIDEAKEQELKVFLDLKLHDIPNTVAKALKPLCQLPIDMINVHAAGGSEMMKRAAEAVKSHTHHPLLIAVTQLTSTNVIQMNKEQRIPGDIVESVTHYAKLAKECGIDGVVSSAQEVQAIKLVCGSRFLTVTPGIRPQDAQTHDQKRITTPKEAILLGADFLVIGRPITESPDPKEALNKILQGN